MWVFVVAMEMYKVVQISWWSGQARPGGEPRVGEVLQDISAQVIPHACVVPGRR
jgi:hypothetical protein